MNIPGGGTYFILSIVAFALQQLGQHVVGLEFWWAAAAAAGIQALIMFVYAFAREQGYELPGGVMASPNMEERLGNNLEARIKAAVWTGTRIG